VKLLTNIGRLYTGTGSGEDGVLTGAALAVDDGRIVWVGDDAAGPPRAVSERVTAIDDCGGGLVTPGLIDAHCHPVYAGERMAEIARRTAGASYGDIAAMGGGIGATVAATRATGAEELRLGLESRLRAWLAGGATTVEAKTGYHLERNGELAAVALLHSAGRDPMLPRLETTFLAAHALPPEMRGSPDDYIAEASSWSAAAAEAGARFCDVFCDEGYFSVEQSRRVLAAGAAAGLRARVHADELAHSGGSLLAAELEAASADHLLWADEADAQALAAAGVVATLSPGTALSIGRLPPARVLLDAGVTVALGTDHNPGTCGMTSMSMVLALAVAAFGLSVDEALTAATAGGARSLCVPDRGAVAVGKTADLVRWDAEHEGAFAWSYGLTPLRVYRGGEDVTLRAALAAVTE